MNHIRNSPTNAAETAWMLSAKQSTFPNAATVSILAEFLEQYKRETEKIADKLYEL